MKKNFLVCIIMSIVMMGFVACKGGDKPEDKVAKELAEVNSGKLYTIATGSVIFNYPHSGMQDTVRFKDYGRILCHKSNADKKPTRYIYKYNEGSKKYNGYTVNDQDKEYIETIDEKTPRQMLETFNGALVDSVKACKSVVALKDTVICNKQCIGYQIYKSGNAVNNHYYNRIIMCNKIILNPNFDMSVIFISENAVADSYFTFNGYTKLQ